MNANTQTLNTSRVGKLNSPEARAKMSASHLGIKLSASHAQKISKGLTGHKRPPETLERFRIASKPKMRPVSVLGVKYESINEAARFHGLYPGTVVRRCQNNSASFSAWYYLDKYL